MNAEERQTPGNYPYIKSPLDQTHTIRIFLQDQGRLHQNFKAHVLLLFGTGYFYYPMVSVPGTTPGSYQVVPDYNTTEQYPFYFRVDMGLTFEFNIFDRKNITLTADVLNVFNQYNITSYSWYSVFPETTQPVPIPNILSARYLNLGFKVDF
jgi:outer membrane receptor protein involved in Fe transport